VIVYHSCAALLSEDPLFRHSFNWVVADYLLRMAQPNELVPVDEKWLVIVTIYLVIIVLMG
jgi:hypothetical protein